MVKWKEVQVLSVKWKWTFFHSFLKILYLKGIFSVMTEKRDFIKDLFLSVLYFQYWMRIFWTPLLFVGSDNGTQKEQVLSLSFHRAFKWGRMKKMAKQQNQNQVTRSHVNKHNTKQGGIITRRYFPHGKSSRRSGKAWVFVEGWDAEILEKEMSFQAWRQFSKALLLAFPLGWFHSSGIGEFRGCF